jgi:hypothetical protein
MHVTLNELGNAQRQLAITIDATDLIDNDSNQLLCEEIGQSFEDAGHINYSDIINKFVENAASHAQPIKKHESAMGTDPNDDQLDN